MIAMMRRDRAEKPCSGESFFDIHGVNVRVACDRADVSGRLSDYLGHYSMEGPAESAGCIQCSVTCGPAPCPAPPGSELVLSYDPICMYLHEGVSYFTDNRSTLTVEPGGTKVHGNVDPRSLNEYGLDFFSNLLFTLSLFEALRFHGLYYLHAAALQGPDGAGYLVCGNAGCGKTTLTLSLIKAGFRYLSDDTVFMRTEGEDVEVRGFAREFHVPVETAAADPLLSRFCMDADNVFSAKKKKLDPGKCFPDQGMEAMLNPCVILFPELDRGKVKLEPMSSAQVLPKIMGQSPAVMFNLAIAKPHLSAIRGVLKHARAFKLNAGPELKDDPRAARRLMESARDMALKEGRP